MGTFSKPGVRKTSPFLTASLFLLAHSSCARPPAGPAAPGAQPPPRATPALAVADPTPDRNPWSAQAREILVKPCGACHISTLETAKPRALAVFDLVEQPWYGHMTEDQFRGIGRRVEASDGIDEWDKKLVGFFVRCQLENQCEGNPPKE